MEKEGVIITREQHPEIYEWLSEYVHDYGNSLTKQQCFTLTSDNKINAYGDVVLDYRIREIKHPFGYVEGNFDCRECVSLTSLVGVPKEVGGYFDCYNCDSITSLIGAPEKVGGYFDCCDCDSITSLIGAPKDIGEYFSFDDYNNLTSLIGFPKYVGGDIDIDFYYNNFSNVPTKKEEYKIYIAMWLELFESVSNEERKEYIKNYKDKKEWNNKQPIIPIEILKEYGF